MNLKLKNNPFSSLDMAELEVSLVRKPYSIVTAQ